MAWVSDRRLRFADRWLRVANQRVEIGKSACGVGGLGFLLSSIVWFEVVSSIIVFVTQFWCLCVFSWWVSSKKKISLGGFYGGCVL